MLTPTTLLELHELVAVRVQALDASEYSQGGAVARWREAETPLNALSEPDFLQHLAFTVLIDRAPISGQDRNTVETTAHARVSFSVLFVFQLLEHTVNGRLGDLKLAYGAARDLAVAVTADWPASDGPELVNAWLPGAIVHDFLPVRVEFVIGLDLDLSI
jgi:hypothetical protein